MYFILKVHPQHAWRAIRSLLDGTCSFGGIVILGIIVAIGWFILKSIGTSMHETDKRMWKMRCVIADSPCRTCRDAMKAKREGGVIRNSICCACGLDPLRKES